ncbi:MAG: lytic murein transglycosylase B [Gammaproteobacteria bacterium]|nr:MAG: lytic murein transglycosylase B [Gammaproteobacteria bacterium]
MKFKLLKISGISLSLLLCGANLQAKDVATATTKEVKVDYSAPLSLNKDLQAIITTIAKESVWSTKELNQIFSKVEIKTRILKIFQRTPEGHMTWEKYRKIFITNDKIEKGAIFYQKNYKTLKKAEKKYGVPAHIITAILGVETRYGENMGSYRVIDALTTLALYHPRRTVFFKKELISYFKLVKKQKLPLFDTYGSYAGAMGLGQFMPSSYAMYAVDFDNDGISNIISNKKDSIGSIANYFKRHKWTTGKKIAIKLDKKIDKKYIVNRARRPKLDLKKLIEAGIDVQKLNLKDGKYAIHSYDITPKKDEYWLSFPNFYVITRYNHSIRYAMAVFQLSEEILTKWTQMKINKQH